MGLGGLIVVVSAADAQKFDLSINLLSSRALILTLPNRSPSRVAVAKPVPCEFGCKSRQTLELAVSEPPNKLDVRSFHVPEFVEAPRKLLPPISHPRFGGRAQNTNSGNVS